MSAISGWGGRVAVSGAINDVAGRGSCLPILSWTLENRAEEIDVSVMGSGFGDYISSITEYEVAFDCLYDTTLNPFLASPFPNLNPGEISVVPSTTITYYTITLSMDNTNALRVHVLPRVLLTAVQVTDEVRGLVKYSVKGKSTRSSTFTPGEVAIFGPVPIKPTANPG